jgi:hypothetical protein
MAEVEIALERKQIHIACRMIDAWRELTVRARDGLHLAHLSPVIRPI